MPVIINGSTGISGTDGSASVPAYQGTDTNTGIFFPAADTIAFAEGGVEALRIDSSGNAVFAGSAVMASSFLRNRIINGNMYIAQRATSATVTAGTAVPTASTGYPCVDRFFVYSTGANVTAAQVAGTGSNRNLLRVTGAASVTAVGIGQRIEAVNSYDLAGQTCTLSLDLANSLLGVVTWTASYANTTDTFGTISVPTKTQIATGTVAVSASLTRYAVNIAIPAAATTGIEILLTVGAQTSGTWDVGNVQLEPGTAATPFERRQFGQELALCQRYYFRDATPAAVPFGAGSPAVMQFTVSLPVTMRATPTGAVLTVPTLTNCTSYVVGANGTGSMAHTVTITGAAGQYGIGSNGFYAANAEL